MSVRVIFTGRVGHNMFQYALGRLIAEHLGFELQCSIPRVLTSTGLTIDPNVSWRAFAFDWPCNFPNAKLSISGLRFAEPVESYENRSGTDDILDLRSVLCNRAPRHIRISGRFQRYEYYGPYRERMRDWFCLKPSSERHLDVKAADVLVNIRRGCDVGSAGWTLPVSYYQTILCSLLNVRRVFVCGTCVDVHVRKALKPYDPIYVEGSPAEHFWLVQRFNRIICSNSAFCWWAAFLSDAQEIYGSRTTDGRVYAFSGFRNVDLNMREPRYHEIDVSASAPFALYVPGNNHKLEILADRGQIDHSLLHWIAEQQKPFTYDAIRQRYDHEDVEGVIQKLIECGAISVEPQYLA